MRRLTLSQILSMQDILIKETGGTEGIRDEGLLDSALHTPFQTFDREYVYKTLEAKAARLGYGLIKNHPFVDGNKRIGMLAMMIFLELNGIEIHCTDQEIIEAGLKLASGEMDYNQFLEWILEHN